MGRGRNAIYLAGTGWDVTGYDIAQDALAVAQADAAAAKVSLKTSVSKHEDFDFGENQYDLIVCLYNFMRPSEPQWPGKFYRALRPGGLVVFQTSWGRDADLAQLMNLWSRFHILRYEDLDAGVVTDDWSPSRTNPTVRLVLRKEAR
jgi:2-polyprenyl-3-methyl-5-hydroxy-6-metoxy-1,4-benzoquinol methylase